MNITIIPKQLSGTVTAIPSKSYAHRLLICASFADAPTALICPDTNQDIKATVDCLRALGAEIHRSPLGYTVEPVKLIPKNAKLNCCESGSTLRFLLPVVGALGVDATFYMEGRLAERPLSPLWEEMERMGCRLSRTSKNSLYCHGQLRSGHYSINGSVSSQFITGLLLASVLIQGHCSVSVTGELESKPYVDMTLDAMSQFGVVADDFTIRSNCRFHSPGKLAVEGDWSNGAFFLAAQALGNRVQITNLNTESSQGDRICESLLCKLKENITIDVKDIPDLVPILAVVASVKQGALFTNIARLRLKESDRVTSVIAMLESLGGKAIATEDTLQVYPATLFGGTVDACNDHRIAMSAAIAATVCKNPVTIIGADCVRKSYPSFWEDYAKLGGIYEQYLR